MNYIPDLSIYLTRRDHLSVRTLFRSSHSYKDLEIDNFVDCPQELTLPRSIVAHIYTARTGNGDFAAYHERFNHQNSLTTCSCGALKFPKHFLQCSRPTHRIPKTPKRSGDATKFLLGTFKGASLLVQWIKDNKFFTDICPKSQYSR